MATSRSARLLHRLMRCGELKRSRLSVWRCQSASPAQLTEEQIRLLQMQEDLDKEYKGRDKETFVGLSVAQTMYRLFLTVTRNPSTAAPGPCAGVLTRPLGGHLW